MLKATMKIVKLILNVSSVRVMTPYTKLVEIPILQRLTQEEKKAINLELADCIRELGRIARYIERVNEVIK